MRRAKKSGRPRAAAKRSRSQKSSSDASIATRPAAAATIAEPRTSGKLAAVSRALVIRRSTDGKRIELKLTEASRRDESAAAAVSQMIAAMRRIPRYQAALI
jgi:hypothetical protein